MSLKIQKAFEHKFSKLIASIAIIMTLSEKPSLLQPKAEQFKSS